MTNIALTLIIFISGLYFILISAFTIGWLKLPTPKQLPKSSKTKFSILIPFRNEAHNLGFLLDGLLQLNYPKSLFEIIFIDDQSEDNSEDIVSSFIQKNLLSWKIIQSKGSKKKALMQGIHEANNPYILSLDADVLMTPFLLQAYDNALQINATKMIAGPVIFTSPNSIWNSFVDLEFMSLVASGAGAMGINMPIMVNGANLLFEKEIAIEALQDVYQQDIASGDDIFLMLYISKHYGSNQIQYLKSKQAIIKTPAPENPKAWLNQRLRWTSKAKHYEVNYTSITALVILIFNLLIFLSFISIPFTDNGLKLAIGLVIFKFIIDFPLLVSAANFFEKHHLLRFVIFSEFLYCFYIVFVGTFGHFSHTKWKGRF